MSSGSASTSRIFVSIASFCDPLLAFTVKSAVDQARHPERLSFGIVDQSHASGEDELPRGAWRTAFVHVLPHHSRGACWARALAMSLYAGEDYFFQIDSHTLFEPDWDIDLVEAHKAVVAAGGNGKVVLSARPLAFEFEEDGTIRRKRFTTSTMKLVPKDNATVLKLAEPVMKFASVNSKETRDLPGFQVSAAFLFASGAFVGEVPYDPWLYFHGEEQNLAIRSFTHGWDIWHPNTSPLLHLYKTRAPGEPPLHWDKEFEEKRSERWVDLRRRAHRRLADLIAGKLTGAYGLGNVRSIDDYLRFGGLSLETEPHDQTPGPDTYDTVTTLSAAQ